MVEEEGTVGEEEGRVVEDVPAEKHLSDRDKLLEYGCKKRHKNEVKLNIIMGDHSACDKPPVDRPGQPRSGQARPKRNFCFEVSGRFVIS